MKLSQGKTDKGVVLILASETQAEVFQINAADIQLRKLGAAIPERVVRPGDDPDKTTMFVILPTIGMALPGAVNMEKLPDLLTALGKLVNIVEGTREKRWVNAGRRLKDTPEWAALYSAVAAMNRPNEKKTDGKENRAAEPSGQ